MKWMSLASDETTPWLFKRQGEKHDNETDDNPMLEAIICPAQLNETVALASRGHMSLPNWISLYSQGIALARSHKWRGDG